MQDLGSHFLLASYFLAFAFVFAAANDPSPLQDFCVAANRENGVFVNGKFCKDPSQVTAEDFFYSGLDKAGDTDNSVGSHINLVSADQIPGLNTMGVSIVRIDYAANGGQNPPHTHPRATELLTVIEGTLKVEFVTSNPNNTLYTKILHKGDVFVFPIGLIHFQQNIGSTPAVAISAASSQNPGAITIANAMFGSNPPIDANILTRAFQLSKKVVKNLQSKF
ncbi:hypothetical protein ACFE04_025317 [Oxalis oulophora]